MQQPSSAQGLHRTGDYASFFSVYRKAVLRILLAGLFFLMYGCLNLGMFYNERIRNYEEYIFPVLVAIGWIIEKQ